MLVTEFIEQLNKINEAGANSAKEKFIADRIKRKYIPVAEKAAKVNEAIKYSIISSKEEGVYIDYIVEEVNFVYLAIMSYTDITAPTGSDNVPSPTEMYDILKSSGADEDILSRIGKDLLEFRYINEQAIEMWEKRNGGLRGIIKDFSQAFSMITPLLSESDKGEKQ